MKNPWMSMWLSAANKAAGPARGAWMAEAQRAQKAWVKAMTTGAVPANKKKAPAKRKKR